MSPIPAIAAEPTRARAATGSEEFLAELTDAAYRTALHHGLAGNFLDAQLDIWSALRGVLDRHRGPTLRIVTER
jgi:uncharacterized membrane protein